MFVSTHHLHTIRMKTLHLKDERMSFYTRRDSQNQRCPHQRVLKALLTQARSPLSIYDLWMSGYGGGSERPSMYGAAQWKGNRHETKNDWLRFFPEISFHFVFDRRKSLIFPKVYFPRSLPAFISPQLGKKKEGIGEQES